MEGRYVDARREAAPAIPVVPSREPARDPGPANVPDDPELRQWRRLLEQLFVSGRDVAAIAERARIRETSFLRELLASGILPEDRLFRAIARELGLAFQHAVDSRRLLVSDRDCVLLLRAREEARPVQLDIPGEPAALLCAPTSLRLTEMKAFLAQRPAIARRMRIVAPTVLREALAAKAQGELTRVATLGLFDRLQAFSALVVANAWQGAFLGGLAIAIPVSFAIDPVTASLALHAAFSFFFLSCVVLRLAAVGFAGPLRLRRFTQPDEAELPVYSVLVALHREAPIVPELLVALGRIEWPRSKLEIRLVCEADDHETLAALDAQALRPWIEIVRVPPGEPRTKPKALAYALPTTSGEFVVLYDAEDRPHPMQLQEAWLRFSSSDENLACLQAPLVIANGAQGWLSSMFAFEYAALFRGLLPFLSRGRLLFPLGGTSNHFRRAALEHVGGWDPYNVTEDADLGTRLRRFGYRCEMITHPTCEDGPTRVRDWVSQRTRWFKGWMQTWLVHMRRPLVLFRDLGAGSFLVSQIVFAGMVVSALAHPILLGSAVFLLSELVLAGRVSLSKSVLIFLDSTNVILGYLAFLALGFQSLTMREKTGFWRVVALTPPYWLLMSLAAWRALYQVMVRPHEWEKTPHYPRRPVVPARSAADERELRPNAGLSRLRDNPVPRR